MATASIPHRAPRRPDPARVVQSYYHQVDAGGRRGAYRRTGDLYNISDETVRRYVLAHEARAAAPPEPDELEYVPPPGAYPEPKPALLAQYDAAELAQNATVAVETPHAEPQPTPVARGEITSSTRSDVAFSPQSTFATHHTAERTSKAEETPQSLHPDDAAPGRVYPGEMGSEVPELPEGTPAVPESPETPRAPDQEPERIPDDGGSPEAPPPTARNVADRPLIVRQVVRVPLERPPAGLVGWLRTHEVARQQLLAWAMFLVLVALTWLG